MDISTQRGAQPITLDKPRVLFFDHIATWALTEKYGVSFARELYTTQGDDIKLKSLDALVVFLFLGLQAEVRENGAAPISEDQVKEWIRPWNMGQIFRATVLAMTGAMAPPKQAGKTEALSQPANSSAAETAGADSANHPKHPGPTKVMTSTKRSASPSRS